jgi:hypothetical protein
MRRGGVSTAGGARNALRENRVCERSGLVDSMGKKTRRTRTPAAPRSGAPLASDDPLFRPIEIPDDLKDSRVVTLLQHALDVEVILEWNVGMRGDHISSRFVTAEGEEDVLMSADSSDRNFGELLHAHVVKLHSLMRSGLAPAYVVQSQR